jgi:hypothetical protein
MVKLNPDPQVKRKDPSLWLTIYFPDPGLKVALERAATQGRVSMGEIAREGIRKEIGYDQGHAG